MTAIWDGKALRVISSVCPHFGGDFDFSEKGDSIRCKWHSWRFDVPTGRCLTYPLKTHLRHYDFEEREGMIVVKAS